jgi:hypothetical protein
VCNFRAVIPFVWRVWTDDNTGWIMRISLTSGVTPAPRRILFFRIWFRDRRSWRRRMFVPFARNTPYARVGALRIKRCAEHKQCNRDRRQNFERFHFHRLYLYHFAARNSDGCSTRQIQKRFEQLRHDQACLPQLAQAVFFFENSELVQFNSSKQGAIDRPH